MYYDNYIKGESRKDFHKLVQYLKVFQARAKLMILITDGENEVGGAESLKAAMQPFLDKKLMQVVIGENIEILYR